MLDDKERQRLLEELRRCEEHEKDLINRMDAISEELSTVQCYMMELTNQLKSPSCS